jgi:hypothetical protein
MPFSAILFSYRYPVLFSSRSHCWYFNYFLLFIAWTITQLPWFFRILHTGLRSYFDLLKPIICSLSIFPRSSLYLAILCTLIYICIWGVAPVELYVGLGSMVTDVTSANLQTLNNTIQCRLLSALWRYLSWLTQRSFKLFKESHTQSLNAFSRKKK